MTSSSLIFAVSQHLCRFFAGSEYRDYAYDFGPIRRSLPSFRVRAFVPSRERTEWVYASIGACEAAGREHLEFVLASPAEEALNIELLAMVANFHADQTIRPLAPGRILDIGRPWLPTARAQHLLISLPYPYGPTLEWCETPDGSVRVLWLLPILDAEARFAEQQGVEALEELFDSAAINYCDPGRQSVV